LVSVSDQEFKSYCSGQIVHIKAYLEYKRAQGDMRDKQEIVAEWVKDYAADYRDKWYKK
jgi:hypothetical protein